MPGHNSVDDLQLGLLDILFDRMPMGVAVLDRDLVLRRCNPTWAGFIERYTETPASRVLPGTRFAALAPGTEETSIRRYRRALAGEVVRQEAVPMECGGRTSYWDVALTPLYQGGEVVGVLDVTIDATSRILAYQTLEQRVAERTRALTTLLDVSHDVASTLDLEPLLGMILDRLKVVVDYLGATVLTLEAGVLRPVAYRGPFPPAEVLRWRLPLADGRVHREAIETRQPVVVPDVHAEDALARAFRESIGPAFDIAFGPVHSWLGVPLIAGSRIVGMLSLDHGETGYYTPVRASLVHAFANQAAVAMENARLYAEEQERRREAEERRRVAESLRDILAILNSERELDEILDRIVEHAGRLLGTDTVALYRLQPDGRTLTIRSSRGLPEDYAATVKIPTGLEAVDRAVTERRPAAIPDLAAIVPGDDRDLDPPVREYVQRLTSRSRAVLAVPLIVKGEVYGGIVLYYRDPRDFPSDDVDLAVTFADQAALAIENARLRAQAEESAVAAERSRLARDLHDAVTQTLFSASLIAEVLPRLWERSPAEGRRRTAELRELARGALAEMRTLLLELRPSALTDAEPGELLRQLVDATIGRARIPIALTVTGSRSLPLDVKFAVYRIAQEALNNVAKHSAAAQVAVSLSLAPAGLELRVADDGRGFDAAAIAPDHLGLGIMRERAEAIGAQLSIDAKVGQGTAIVVRWSDPHCGEVS